MKKRRLSAGRAGILGLAILFSLALVPATASAGVFGVGDGPVDVTGSHFNEGYNDTDAFQCSGKVAYKTKRPSRNLEYDLSCDSFIIGYVISSNKPIDSYDTESIVTDPNGTPSPFGEGFDCEGFIPGSGFSCRGNGSLDLDLDTSGQQMPSLSSIPQKTSGAGTDSNGNSVGDCSLTTLLCLGAASSYSYEKTGAKPLSVVIGSLGTQRSACSKDSRRHPQRFFLSVYGYRYVEKVVSLDDPAVPPIRIGGYKLTASQPIRMAGPKGRCKR